jgi:hypothetical protein
MLKVWMSHGDKVTAARRASPSWPPPTAFRSPPWPTKNALLRRAVPPGSDPHRAGPGAAAPLRAGSAAARPCGHADNIIDDQIAKRPRAGGRDEVILGLSGGVDSSVAARCTRPSATS